MNKKRTAPSKREKMQKFLLNESFSRFSVFDFFFKIRSVALESFSDFFPVTSSPPKTIPLALDDFSKIEMQLRKFNLKDYKIFKVHES